MKSKRRLINRFTVEATFLMIIAIGFLAYQFNVLGMQQVVVHQETTRAITTSRNKIAQRTRLEIRNRLMRQTEKKAGLIKQGFISIPKVGILEPVFNAAYTKQGLAAGANYANRSVDDPDGEQAPIMGQENYGIASHNFNDGKTGFSALQQQLNQDAPYVKNGKLFNNDWLNHNAIYLANATEIYEYQITSQKTVTENDVRVLNRTQKARVTLICCLFPSTQYRIVTVGRLVKTYRWQNAPSKVVHYFDLTKQPTNAHASWFNKGIEEGQNGDAGGTISTQ